MKAKIEIKMDNAAFETDPHGEVARILLKLAGRIARDQLDTAGLFDDNGNLVGEFKIVAKKV